jgi:hypothetical protein
MSDARYGLSLLQAGRNKKSINMTISRGQESKTRLKHEQVSRDEQRIIPLMTIIPESTQTN